MTNDIVTLKNGTLYDRSTGKFVKGGTPTTRIQDSGRGRELAKRRQEKRERLARERLAELAEQEGLGKSCDEYYAHVTKEAGAAALANMMDRPDRAVKAAEFALDKAGMVRPKEQAEAAPGIHLDLSAEVAGYIVEAWRAFSEARRLKDEQSPSVEVLPSSA